MNYGYWATSYRDCDGSQWMPNGANCIDSCSSGQYYNFVTYNCESCHPTCLTCYEYQQCLTCNATQKRYLSNHSCIPLSGYYEPGTTIALLCDTNCVTCSQSATNCTSCTNLTTLVGTQCLPCSQVWEGCTICSQTACLGCSSPYRQINSSYCNLPCSDSHCLVCSNSNTSFCYVCVPIPYRVLSSSGECLPVCGDAILIDY